VHVAVGSHPGVSEQVPGAADVGAPFEDEVAPVGAQRLQVIPGADTGDTGTDHDHIEVLCGVFCGGFHGLAP
jgi:hypothetical protein